MSQDSKKILLLSTKYLPDIGGAELAIKAISDNLKEYHFDMVTSKSKITSSQFERMGNVNIFRVGSRTLLFNFVLPKILLPLLIFFRSMNLLKKNKYDLIFVSQASQAAGALWLLRKFKKIKQPVILNMQEGKDLHKQFFLLKFLRKAILKQADFFTVISTYLFGYLLDNKINKNKVELIPNGVSVDDFGKEFNYSELNALSNKLGIRPEHKVIISVGRLVPKNGIDLLIRAFAILIHKNRCSKFKLILPGDGPDKEYLYQLAVNLGIDDDVIFTGIIMPDELPKYFALYDIFVRPSRSEGLGNAFLEAMAAGLPIVGTPVGGIPDFLKDEETGLFCESENPESIATKMQLIIDDKELNNKLIKNGYRLVSKKYQWKIIADQYRTLFNKLMHH